MGAWRRMTGKSRFARTQSIVPAMACWALVLAGAGQSQAQQPARAPQGVYAHVDLELAINNFFGGTAPASCPPPATPGLHAYLQSIYKNILMNTAVAGLALGARWCLIQTSEYVFDWSYLEEAFDAAKTASKTATRSVQLLITPGNDSPSWLLNGQSCDPVIKEAAADPAYSNCQWVTFKKLPETQQNPYSMKLLLPFGAIYPVFWTSFLSELNAKYGGRTEFVSIAVAGPTSVSTEMILPTTANKSQFESNPHNISVDMGWEYLVETIFPLGNYNGQWGQAFIDAWRQTILAYENIFSGATLTLTPDDGKNMPELPFATTNPMNLVATDCSHDTDIPLSCAAKAIVLYDFVVSQGVNENEKAVLVGGFEASSKESNGDIGLPAVKGLTSMPASPPILGGAEFDYAVSTKDEKRTREEGCKHKGCTEPLTPAQAAYNVLSNFFSGTIAAENYGGTSPAPALASPLQFLNMDYRDVLYANDNVCMQELITQASRDLLATAGKAPFQLSAPQSCWLQ